MFADALASAAPVGETGRMKIAVLDAATLDFPDDAWAEFRALGSLVLHDLTPSDAASIQKNCAGAQVVLTNKVPLDAATLAALPDLRLIAVLATGFNIIDAPAARARGVTVCNAPGYSTASVVQHTLALMLEWSNQVALHDASVRAGDWVRSPRFSYWKLPLHELAGRTVGLIGFGAIGAQVGAVANALGAKVLAYSRRRQNPPPWGPFAWAGVEEIFAQADVVSLHCPQTAENTRFVNAALLARMKPDALFINTARGGLVDEAALAAALRAGRPRAAAVDVVAQEPMRADCPLLGAPNCLITPHLAWASEEARWRLLGITLANVRKFIAGTPQNVVN
jgi:glycerate dehydrogenase